MSSCEGLQKIIESVPIDAPPWAMSLIMICKSLFEQLKDFNDSIKEIALLGSKVAVQGNTIDLLKQDNDRLHNCLSEISLQVDSNEQHDRNVNLVLHGVPETKEEDTSVKFVKALSPHNMPIRIGDIARSHRLGRFRADSKKPRPIIARFWDENKKIKLFKTKKNLKGKGIVLTENLTKYRQYLFNKAVTVLGFRNVWTNEGRIISKFKGRYIQITNEMDIHNLPVEPTVNSGTSS